MFRHKYVMSLLPPRRLQSLIVANMKMVHGQTQLMVNYVLSWSAKVCWFFFPNYLSNNDNPTESGFLNFVFLSSNS